MLAFCGKFISLKFSPWLDPSTRDTGYSLLLREIDAYSHTRLVKKMSVLFVAFAAVASTSSACRVFCGVNSEGKAQTFDLSSLPNKTFTLQDKSGYGRGSYLVSAPCGCAAAASTARGFKCSPMIQGNTRGLADIAANISLDVGADGFNLTIGGGSNDPPMPHGRNAVYHFVCDKTAPLDNPPDPTVVESPPGYYNLVWRHPSVCHPSSTPTTCPPPPPLPPLPPPPPPPPPVIPCGRGSHSCLPSWKPTWELPNRFMNIVVATVIIFSIFCKCLRSLSRPFVVFFFFFGMIVLITFAHPLKAKCYTHASTNAVPCSTLVTTLACTTFDMRISLGSSFTTVSCYPEQHRSSPSLLTSPT